jgi:hypothetical protein
MSYFTCSTDKHKNNLTTFYSRAVRLLFLYKQILCNELLTQYKIISHASWRSTDFRNKCFLGSLCAHKHRPTFIRSCHWFYPEPLHSGLTANSKHNSCLFPWMMQYCPCILTIYSTHTLTPVLTHSGNLPRACLRYSFDSLNKGPLLYTS